MSCGVLRRSRSDRCGERPGVAVAVAVAVAVDRPLVCTRPFSFMATL
jgi:hypothetical protein